MDYSRDSFYRLKELHDGDGKPALQEVGRKKPMPQNREDPPVEQAVAQAAERQPNGGKGL